MIQSCSGLKFLFYIDNLWEAHYPEFTILDFWPKQENKGIGDGLPIIQYYPNIMGMFYSTYSIVYPPSFLCANPAPSKLTRKHIWKTQLQFSVVQ